MKPTPTGRQVNWIPFPNPISEAEVKLEIQWSADPRTTEAIRRQAKCCGFKSIDAYLLRTLKNALVDDERDTPLWRLRESVN
jgi:Mg2+ and Co2+ transporter CorA